MSEIWKTIPESVLAVDTSPIRYAVSNHGRVRRQAYYDSSEHLHFAKVLAQGVDSRGYKFVVLDSVGKTKFYVHGLVGCVFVPNKNRLTRIKHLDGDLSNNFADNLVWSSSGGAGLIVGGSNEVPVKVQAEALTGIRMYSTSGELVREFEKLSDISPKFKVSIAEVKSCCLKKPKGKLLGGFLWRWAGDDELFGVAPVERLKLAGLRGVRKYSQDGLMVEYSSVDEASYRCMVPPDGIKRSCSRKQLRCSGYIWRYVDDDEFTSGVDLVKYIKDHDKRLKG